jgi:hypothetical protein
VVVVVVDALPVLRQAVIRATIPFPRSPHIVLKKANNNKTRKKKKKK